MLWVGKDEKTVYILTDKNILYRSTDEGKSWSDEMSRLKRSDSDRRRRVDGTERSG